MGFNPASEPKAAEADPGPCRELPGAEPSARFGSGASPRMPWKTVRRCPSGMCRPACRTGASASPCPHAGEPLASKSTRRKLPTVPERSRLCQEVSNPANTAASGAEKHPRKFSGIRLASHSVTTNASRKAVSVSPRSSAAAHIDFTEQLVELLDDCRRPIVLDQRRGPLRTITSVLPATGSDLPSRPFQVPWAIAKVATARIVVVHAAVETVHIGLRVRGH